MRDAGGDLTGLGSDLRGRVLMGWREGLRGSFRGGASRMG